MRQLSLVGFTEKRIMKFAWNSTSLKVNALCGSNYFVILANLEKLARAVSVSTMQIMKI
jgi:hypothetical protein